MKKNLRGMTMIETIVTIGVFSMVMIAITNSVLYFYRANETAIEQSYQIDSARRGVGLMVRDLRETTYAENGAFPLSSIGSTSLTFYSDTDRDSAVERIRYSLSGIILSRAVTEPVGDPPVYTSAAATSSVSLYVRNEDEGVPIFRYFDANGTELTDYAHDIADVVSVKVDLVVNVLPLRAPEEFTLRSSATLRNLRPQ